MNSINEILTEVLKEIVPTEKELILINDIVEKVKILLDKKAKELNIEYTIIEPQGSTGIKQTQLKNDFDIDIFVGLQFNLNDPFYQNLSKSQLKKESKKDFLRLCHDWIIKALTSKEFRNPRILYAEHPYVQVDYISPEIVTVLDIVLYFDLSLDYIVKYGPITAVDRSPWHGRFVRDNLTQEQKNDVRLLKQFFKACHSYGDKSAVGKIGFIGYSAELLIYHFKTLLNAFTNFKDLHEKPLDYFNRNKKELMKIIHFQNDFLIVTDPTDMNRNVASAISEIAYKYCNDKIKEFFKNPSKDFFDLKSIPEANVANSTDPLLQNIFIIELKSENDEIHYTIFRDKLYSLGESVKVNSEKEFSHEERFGKIEFEVYFEEELREYNLVIYCEKSAITSNYIRKGPPLNEKEHVNKFKKKNPNFLVKDGYLWAETKRKYTDFYQFLNDFVKNKIPDHLEVVNISTAFNTKTTSGKRAIYVLENIILPHS